MRFLQALRDGVTALLFPQENACHLCSRGMENGGMVCPVCQKKLEAVRMRQAIALLPDAPIRQCWAVWRFRGPARALVYHVKYFGDTAIAQFMGEWMALAAKTRFDPQPDLLIPVPLHAARQKERGYNQAVLLARVIAARTGLPVEEEALRRIRVTPTLVHSSRRERMSEMAGAFEASSAPVQGKRILLIDDVFTTGATSMACAAALLEAGAAEVCVLTACHAEADDDMKPIPMPYPRSGPDTF